MKILFVDQDNFQTQTRRTLIEEKFEAACDLASTLAEVHMKFRKGTYDLVIMDHNGVENGQLCFDYMISEDPDQNVLTVSNAVQCVIKRCEDCVNNHSIRRLSNPTSIPNILRMIEGFVLYECDHYDHETNLLSV
jgi:hypothetical protein